MYRTAIVLPRDWLINRKKNEIRNTKFMKLDDDEVEWDTIIQTILFESNIQSPTLADFLSDSYFNIIKALY